MLLSSGHVIVDIGLQCCKSECVTYLCVQPIDSHVTSEYAIVDIGLKCCFQAGTLLLT